MWRWRRLHCMVAPLLLQDPAVKRGAGMSGLDSLTERGG